MKTPLLFTILLLSFSGYATGIKGTIKTNKGEPLAFAAVAVKGTSQGTMANANGQYELSLTVGQYTVVFQYLGFKTLTKEITISANVETLNVILEEQTLSLDEVKIGSKTEDPALTVMRRAIAKARFHALQVEAFSARVYNKGSVTFVKLPWIVRKMIDDPQIKEGGTLLNEAVTDVNFKQPNSFSQRVISTRNNFDNSFPSPMGFVMSSFYNPTVSNGVVSPLSPKAFGYYKFVYEGSFIENGQEVNRIKVVPRAFGDGVFRGRISIIENSWAIHSLDLETYTEGFLYSIKQVYNPIQDVWMPTNQQYIGSGGMVGASIKGQYVVSVNYKSVKVNPKFKSTPIIIDEKLTKPAVNLSKAEVRSKKLEDLAQQQKELSTKQLRQLMRQYEKREYQARKERKEDVSIVSSDSITTDSLANKRSKSFWDSLRTVPLTIEELKGYRQYDSISVKKGNTNIRTSSENISISVGSKPKADSTQKKKASKVSVGGLLTESNYRLSKKSGLRLYTEGPLKVGNINYNTVEGLWLSGSVKLQRIMNRLDSNQIKKIPPIAWQPKYLALGATARYEMGLKRVIGVGFLSFLHHQNNISLSAGQMVQQYNQDTPMPPFINLATTLLLEQNFMKLYQRQFGQVKLEYELKPRALRLMGSVEYANRSTLDNLENAKPWINWSSRDFTSNIPLNVALPNGTYFAPHHALTLKAGLVWRPAKEKARLSNGTKIDESERDLTLKLNYTKGIPNVGQSKTDFDFIEINARQDIETGIRSELKYSVSVGVFANKKRLYFPDYKHFSGNQIFFQMGDAFNTFRNLPYYEYSTGKSYVEAHVTSIHRKLLLTQIPVVRMLNLKENLMVHYLKTPHLPHYTELGYVLDGIIPGYPFFRVEAVGIFQNFKYQNTVFRVGTTWKFGD